MIATESDLREIRNIGEAYFWCHWNSTTDRLAEQLCAEYEQACDEREIAPVYDDTTLDGLGIRYGMIAEASYEGHGIISGTDWVRINRHAPLIPAPREPTHHAILRALRAERARDDERARDPAELAAAREHHRESLEGR